MRFLGLIILLVVLAPCIVIMELLLFWLDHADAIREELEDLEDSEDEAN